MRHNAKVMGAAVAIAATLSLGLGGCAWQGGAASEEDLAKQVTYEDADTKPQVIRNPQAQEQSQDKTQTKTQTKSQGNSQDKSQSQSKSNSQSQSKSKSKSKKTTGSDSASSQSKKTESISSK